MDGKTILKLLILAGALYLFYINFDFNTMQLKKPAETKYHNSGRTQQSELYEAAKSL